jgi:hypothetical protein
MGNDHKYISHLRYVFNVIICLFIITYILVIRKFHEPKYDFHTPEKIYFCVNSVSYNYFQLHHTNSMKIL